jgi:hypothetical protein
MASYSVFSGNRLIGTSDLERGDPPMGVASGKLRPTSVYATIRAECIAALDTGRWEPLALSVQTENGKPLPAQGGVMILDSQEIDLYQIEVHVAGIPYPLYEELFPTHVENYRTRKY